MDFTTLENAVTTTLGQQPNTTTESTYALDGEEIALIVLKILVYVVGVIGNILVIFVILFLGEFKKITHWYVLQMALADVIFLQVIPFKLTEDVHGGWIHGMGFCSTQQTVLFFTYYASILFLMIMAIDRYLAVSHPLSNVAQRIRTSRNSYIVAVVTWIVALLMSIPAMIYSTTVGIEPHCKCTLLFPKDPEKWCKVNGFEDDVATCVASIFPAAHGPTCSSMGDFEGGSGTEVSSGVGSGYFSDYFGFSGSDLFPDVLTDTDATTATVDTTTESGGLLLPGCFYDPLRRGWTVFILYNFIVMFVIPLLVIVTCYGLIVYRLASSGVSSASSGENGSGRIWKPGRKKSSGSSSRSDREKKKVTLLCALLALLFTIFWLPFHSVHLAKFVGIVTDDERFCSRLGTVTSILAYLSSATNPYLYNFLGSFKKRMKQIKNSKRMRSFLSATGMTRATSGGSSEGSKARSSIAHSQNPAEQIPLKTIEDK